MRTRRPAPRALQFALCSLLMGGTLRGDVFQLDISAQFNADVVVNGGSGMLDPVNDPIDHGLIETGNFCFMTQSVAEANAVDPQTPDGLPDDASFPAGVFNPGVQLGWNENDDGLNAWRLEDMTGGLRLLPPPGQTTEVHVFATSGNGTTQVVLRAIYSDGAGPDVPYGVPDWFDDPIADADLYDLVNDLDRMQPGNGPGSLFEFSDRDAAAIFGLRLLVDPSRVLDSVEVERTDTNGVLNVFGAVSITDDPSEACCLPDGSCQDVGPGACLFLGGTPQGPATDCAGTACPQAEACCFMDGSCSDLLPMLCQSMGGISEGPDTECATTACPQFEACCFADGTCMDLEAAGCEMQGGLPRGSGSTCASSDCAVDEACCFAGGLCLDLRPAECTALDGIPAGGGTQCAIVVCDLPTLPGWAPNGNGRAGTPLSVAKGVDDGVDLSWGRGCSDELLDFTVHEGSIGDWYSHEAIACDTDGALTRATITPGSNDRYYLIAAITEVEEGSYGLDSMGIERPVSILTTCVDAQVLDCP